MPARDPFDRYGQPVEVGPKLYPVLSYAGDIAPEARSWLWPGYIPRSALTLLIGDPGIGKSLLVADLAARVSAGRPWPSAAGSPSCLPPSGVLLVCPEDRPADTLLPRLLAAGADLAYVCILDGVTPIFQPLLGPPEPVPTAAAPFFLPDHLSVLRQAIAGVRCRALVVLDPLNLLLSSAAQNNPAVLATALGGLGDLAHRLDVAVVATGHLAKTRALRTLYRVRGSLALVAAARSVHLLAADPDQADRRILTPLKSVFGPPPPPLAFHIASCEATGPETSNARLVAALPSAPRLQWEEVAPVCGTHPDLLDLAPDAQSALSEARDWLADALASAPRPARELLADARAAGLSLPTLRRAKRLLRVSSVKPAADSPWLWSREQRPDNQDDQPGGAEI